MISLPGSINGAPLPGTRPPMKKNASMEDDQIEPTGELNGCVTQVARFLRELIEMTGQDAATTHSAILELQFGEILTKTSIQSDEKNYLLIMAFLPKCRRSQFMPRSGDTHAQGDLEFFWHADEGRHIGVRRIPVAELEDERSVMDAILSTSEQASAWFSSTRSGKH